MNIYDNVMKMIAKSQAKQLFLATATGNATGNLEEIKRDGQSVADSQRYPTLSSCPALIAGNRVLVWQQGITCVILGRIDS